MRSACRVHSLVLATFAAAAAAVVRPADESATARAIRGAELCLRQGDLTQARALVDRALERDPKLVRAWELRAAWAEAAGDLDERVYALHVAWRLARAQKAPKGDLEAAWTRLTALDPFAVELRKLRDGAADKLVQIADRYEKERRPHSAIRVHRLLLALDPERTASEEAIQRISAAPDPSLAETAKAKDLLADISDEWIREFDAQHATWEARAVLDRENYKTSTDAGYAVLVRAGEAMEQMNAFYRQFFRYGGPEDNRRVPRIEVRIFKDRDEYLKLGTGPPVEWSGGQFTGAAVETYIGAGGFEEAVTTLFHEAAHQFVSLATSAAGWLNEGLASYFEGTRILANGTVVMNLPANHRLFPLADRMSRGWMSSAYDGIDAANPSKSEPEKAPTFRIVLENEYAWGPPWYAPTWGVVYFLWNYQDTVDGRFVYRNAFRTFVNTSGGRIGKGAVENFEKVVLGNPEPPTPKLDPKLWKQAVKLPKTIDELTEVWKEWVLELRDEQSGKLERARPRLAWARYALQRKDLDTAAEHFEKGAVETPGDVELLLEFAKFLAKERKNLDRAAKLAREAAAAAEAKQPVDAALVQRCEQAITQYDTGYATLEQICRSLGTAGRSLARRYLAAGYPMMCMDVAWNLANELGLASLYEEYEAALLQCKKSLTLWKLAYNEKNLDGWSIPGTTTFTPQGEVLASSFGAYAEDQFTFQFLTLDTVTSGDFSIEAEVAAERGKVNFCGLVFGKKSASTFHAFVYFPPRGAGVETGTGYVDLTSFYGAGQHRVWRHNAVKATPLAGVGTRAAAWHRLRVDVTGRQVDVWFDGEFVVTHEFPSLDALRGSFGLLTGPGDSQYRNIRFVSRAPRDRAAAIERAVRLGARAGGGDGSDGSWLGSVPPFPEVRAWLQGEVSSWAEIGPAPVLLVFWSTAQNAKIPVDAWLRALAVKVEPIGLRILAIASQESAREVEAYVKEHPFPGSVGVDATRRHPIGDTFRAFGADQFGLPRLVLLDLDHRVVWEGDPGFRLGKPWAPGDESYVELPIDELAARRKLAELVPWRRAWRATALPAMAAGNLTVAAPFLKKAAEFDPGGDPDVALALARAGAIEGAVSALDTIARSFADAEREPALSVLLAWGQLIGQAPPAKVKAAASFALDSPRAKQWRTATELLRAARGKLIPGREVETANALLEKLGDLEGAFCEELARELQSLVGYEDAAGITAFVKAADELPARWLAHDYFRW